MISIIIPIYNAEQWLPRLIGDIQAQKLTDYEVLLIDDGSTDQSGILCDQVAALDARFRCIHQENGGVSSARNHGLQEVKGEYVTFLDSDDHIDRNYLKTLLTACTGQRADIAICDVIAEQNGKELYRFSHPVDLLTQRETLNQLLTRRQINSGPCAKLFRREILEGLAFPPLKTYEDILFVKDAICHAQHIAITDQTAYHYIDNSNGAMSAFLKTPSLDIITATDTLLSFILSRSDLSPDCFYITASHLMQYVQPMLSCPAGQNMNFISAAQTLYHKYCKGILSCRAFPWKEKLVYLAFAKGWTYHDRKLSKIKVR